MPEGGILTLRTKIASGELLKRAIGTGQIEVRTPAWGMEKRPAAVVWSHSYDQRRTRHRFGLAMVYGIVQRQNAEIEIESELGKGTTIRLTSLFS